MTQIDLVVGARPNFMKAAPVLEELRARKPGWNSQLIHTGQHYDERMSDLFFRQLGMPQPDVNLGIGSGTHAVQTARIMMKLEETFTDRRPDLVIVFGDVNSTVAAALVASKMGIPLAHVEAGLRSFDRTMPEEINRVLTDAVSDYLFTTEPSAETNLRREGIPVEKIHFVGNTMIDSLLKHRERALGRGMPTRLGVVGGRYAVVTLHRPSNVDGADSLRAVMSALGELAGSVPVIFPVHPRTEGRLRHLGLWDRAVSTPGMRLLGPMGYLEFIGLMAGAGVVLTDSGGIQEETTILGVPCVTLRNNTERPVTLTQGTNMLAGDDPWRMLAEARRVLDRRRPAGGQVPAKWDGQAAVRIVDILEEQLG